MLKTNRLKIHHISILHYWNMGIRSVRKIHWDTKIQLVISWKSSELKFLYNIEQANGQKFHFWDSISYRGTVGFHSFENIRAVIITSKYKRTTWFPMLNDNLIINVDFNKIKTPSTDLRQLKDNWLPMFHLLWNGHPIVRILVRLKIRGTSDWKKKSNKC
jgi:hypothetical protein